MLVLDSLLAFPRVAKPVSLVLHRGMRMARILLIIDELAFVMNGRLRAKSMVTQL
jgi:hypothetical protein